MAFSSAPKAFQSLENTHRKRSVSFFKKSLEFYASSIELSEDGKNGVPLVYKGVVMGESRITTRAFY